MEISLPAWIYTGIFLLYEGIENIILDGSLPVA